MKKLPPLVGDCPFLTKFSPQIISGQFIFPSRISSYVEVDMYGLPDDTVRKKYKTRTIENNNINPCYDTEFSFEKVAIEAACVAYCLFTNVNQVV